MTITAEKPTTLARLAEILNAIKMPAHYTMETPEVPFEKLVVALDNAQTIETPIYLVNLYFVEDLLTPAQDLGEDFNAELKRTSTLQFYIEQPLELNPEKLLDTYRLLSMLGRWVPVGGSLSVLESHEGSDLYYTYAMPTDNKTLNALWIIDILETMQLFLTGFFPRVHAFQTSDESLEEVIADIQNDLQNMMQEGFDATQETDTPE